MRTVKLKAWKSEVLHMLLGICSDIMTFALETAGSEKDNERRCKEKSKKSGLGLRNVKGLKAGGIVYAIGYMQWCLGFDSSSCKE